MRNIIFTLCVLLFTSLLFAQTYKLENVYSSGDDFKISHLKPIENNKSNDTHLFSFWGIQNLKDEIPFLLSEFNYFKGNANEVYEFLTALNKLEKKYPHKEVLTTIMGVKLRIGKSLGTRYTLLYDKEGKISNSLSKRQLSRMLTRFTTYCQQENINYLP